MIVGWLKSRFRRLNRSGRARWLVHAATFLWQQGKLLRDRLNFPEVMRALQEPRPDTLEDRIAFVMDRFGGAIRPIQKRAEITALAARVEALRPRTVLEIGTAKGGTLYLLCQAAAEDATIISLDLPYGRNGGGYPRWKEPAYRRFAKPGQTLHLLRADSHAPESLARVREILAGRPLDFMMIDGDHSHEGVRADFEMYGALMSPDGLIALHDILENRFDPSIDVHPFWLSLKEGRRTEEIVADPNQGNCGIGLVLGPARTA